MAQILITPLPGTARSFNGRVLTGGHHYMLVQKNEVEILNGADPITLESILKILRRS